MQVRKSVRVTRYRVRFGFVFGSAVSFLVLVTGQATAQASCPTPPPVTISPQALSDVCPPPAGFPIEAFDDFSWRSFIALTWTAKQGERGIPDSSKPYGPVAGPLVFETYKNDWEVFQPSPDGKTPPPAPAPWNSYAGRNPCDAAVAFGDVVLSSFSKFGNLGQADFGSLVGPLPAQNGTYTRYSTAFNKIEFDQISGDGLYLRSSLEKLDQEKRVVSFSSGAIDIKASWIIMDGIKNPGHYYTRTALVLDPFKNPPTCSKVTVGLVGLHIVVKTQSRAQWIWSTFEQVDNVPGGSSSGPFAFNNGNPSDHQPKHNPIQPISPTSVPPEHPTPFNVERGGGPLLQPQINSFTVGTNKKYRAALSTLGGPWQFYQLVMTQWPVDGSAARQGDTTNTSPPQGDNPVSAFANVTLETFDQKSIQSGCMNCHNADASQNPDRSFAKVPTDFLWTLELNAWPSTLTPPSSAVEALSVSPQMALSGARKVSPQLEALKNLMAGFAAHEQ
jgi:hypothetical protein